MRPTAPVFALKVKPRPVYGSPFAAKSVGYAYQETSTRTTSRQTNFNHLVHHKVPRLAQGTTGRLPTGQRTKGAYFVHWDDRVKFWNVAPGDRVVVADAPTQWRGKKGTVAWVDRTRNRLALLEPEFRKDIMSVSYFRGQPVPRQDWLEFEYSSVRLLSPYSDDLFYDDLQEDSHASIPTNAPGVPLGITWRRTGLLKSLVSGETLGREEVPWPVKPKWSRDVETSEAVVNEIKADYEKAQKKVAAKQEREARRMNMSPEELEADVHAEMAEREAISETERKELEDAWIKRVRHDRRQRDAGFNYLYTSEKIAWERTFTSEPYDPLYLRLSADPSIRTRFPELFWRPSSPSSPSTSSTGSTFTDALLRPAYVPDLAVQDWEYTAGRHTERFRTKRFEARLTSRLADKADAEAQEIFRGAAASNDGVELPENEKLRIRQMLSTLNSFESRVHRRPRLSVDDRRAKRAAMTQARHTITLLKHKHERQQISAALALLPELERFNTERMREKMVREGKMGTLGREVLRAASTRAATNASTNAPLPL